ncbi:MAG: hypothetical protein GX608_13900 [Lentisphaerae bacterium]|nr:hypothetical protein [Lentisphaerota bacterium]
MSIYLQLTRQFNHGRLRAILSGGQAVVMHRLAIMSKDGDWILREDEESMRHVLAVLDANGAHYRFGAPLDIRWLSAGWSAHLEFMGHGLRVRTDFVTRPPRLSAERLDGLWREQDAKNQAPFLGARDLVETKKTNREKDYAVIGELARGMGDIDDQIMCSRSARDLMELAAQRPDRVIALTCQRPVLAAIAEGPEALEVALDAERRRLMHANEARLAMYMSAAEPWARVWHEISREMEAMPLAAAHSLMVDRAGTKLPFTVPGGWP